MKKDVLYDMKERKYEVKKLNKPDEEENEWALVHPDGRVEGFPTRAMVIISFAKRYVKE